MRTGQRTAPSTETAVRELNEFRDFRRAHSLRMIRGTSVTETDGAAGARDIVARDHRHSAGRRISLQTHPLEKVQDLLRLSCSNHERLHVQAAFGSRAKQLRLAAQ